jgi:hypothetical protein
MAFSVLIAQELCFHDSLLFQVLNLFFNQVSSHKDVGTAGENGTKGPDGVNGYENFFFFF